MARGIVNPKTPGYAQAVTDELAAGGNDGALARVLGTSEEGIRGPPEERADSTSTIPLSRFGFRIPTRTAPWARSFVWAVDGSPRLAADARGRPERGDVVDHHQPLPDPSRSIPGLPQQFAAPPGDPRPSRERHPGGERPGRLPPGAGGGGPRRLPGDSEGAMPLEAAPTARRRSRDDLITRVTRLTPPTRSSGATSSPTSRFGRSPVSAPAERTSSRRSRPGARRSTSPISTRAGFGTRRLDHCSLPRRPPIRA